MTTWRILAASLSILALPSLAAVEVHVSPAAKAYRKVLITAARVELDRESLSPRASVQGHLPRVTRDAARSLEREMAESFEVALARAFRARGYEVVRSPGADVLALTPALKGLRVNAPETSAPGIAKVYVREAGQATMEVEGHDAAGSRVIYAAEMRTTGRITELTRATDVSNRFWFGTMFRRWADELVSEIARAR